MPSAPSNSLRVAKDTNVYFSALTHPLGAPAKLWRKAVERRYVLLTSPPMMREIARVLRIKAGWGDAEIDRFLKVLVRVAQIVSPDFTLRVVFEDDQRLASRRTSARRCRRVRWCYRLAADMNVEKTMEFILQQQAKNEALHAKNEALHAKHEARFAKLESGHAEHKADIKEIRRLLLKSAAVGVEVRRQLRLLAEESRETKKEVRDLTRALRGRGGNGASRNGGVHH